MQKIYQYDQFGDMDRKLLASCLSAGMLYVQIRDYQPVVGRVDCYITGVSKNPFDGAINITSIQGLPK